MKRSFLLLSLLFLILSSALAFPMGFSGEDKFCIKPDRVRVINVTLSSGAEYLVSFSLVTSQPNWTKLLEESVILYPHSTYVTKILVNTSGLEEKENRFEFDMCTYFPSSTGGLGIQRCVNGIYYINVSSSCAEEPYFALMEHNKFYLAGYNITMAFLIFIILLFLVIKRVMKKRKSF